MKEIFVLLMILNLIIIPLIYDSDALLQSSVRLNFELQPGESQTLQWILGSDSDDPFELDLRIEGEGSEFVTFPEKVPGPPREVIYIDVTVTIPEDHPNDVFFSPHIFAKQRGVAQGGGAIISVAMTTPVNIKIGNPIIEEAKAETVTESTQEQGAETIEPSSEVTQEETTQKEEPQGLLIASQEEEGGGCLIATAAFGSELAPQVQMLREIRDNTLLKTTSGTSFMIGFNQFYYSFSPTIADWERENQIFQDVVRITITPLIASLSILNYIDIDSEEQMLGYGISLILLNVGMYFVAPAVVILRLKDKIKIRSN